MHEDASDLFKPDAVSQLIEFDGNDRAVWPAEDLRAALHRQLASPLAGAFGKLSELAKTARPPIHTLAGLLHHPQPPLRLLRMCKDLARTAAEDPHSPVAPEIAALLYAGSIAIARLRCGSNISRLPEDLLRQQLSHLLRQPWVDDATQRLLLEALRHLRSPIHRWRP